LLEVRALGALRRQLQIQPRQSGLTDKLAAPRGIGE
jgi:hypothetical protein